MKRIISIAVVSSVLLMASNSYAKNWWYPGKVEIIPGSFAMHRGVGLDFQAEIGVGLINVDSLEERFFLRQRVGLLYFYEPWFYALGVTVEELGMPSFAVGIEAEVSNLAMGGWVEGGVSIGRGQHIFMHAGIGWSTFGVEWQHQVFGTEADAHALLLKLRIPLGILFMGLQMK